MPRTLPESASGANCSITIPGFGRARVKATRVVHGMSMVAYSGGDESANGFAWYPSKRTSGSFELTLIFASHGAYQRINSWLVRYARWASNPGTSATPARVVIPSRNFDKTGALDGGMTFGDRVGATSYSMTLAFVGARDPLEMTPANLSTYIKPRSKDPALEYLHPAGTILKGGERGWDTVYDTPPDELAPDFPEPIDPLGPAAPAGP